MTIKQTAESGVKRGRQAQMNVLGKIDVAAGMRPEMFAGKGLPDVFDDPESWDRKSDLDKATPKPRDGYEQKWVRIRTVDGNPDVANKQEALIKGWRVRAAHTLDMSSQIDRSLPVFHAEGLGDVIVFSDDLVLFERTIESGEKERRAQRNAQAAMTDAIYNQRHEGAGTNMHPRYGSIGFESGGGADGLVDD